MKFFYTFLFILLLPLTLKAEVPSWQIIPEKSTLSFQAIQNNAPVTGQFKKFNGEIYFDPDQLDKSKINISVDISSLKTSYSDLKTTLMTPAWFDVNKSPKATFKATTLIKRPDHNFEAIGELTLKNVTIMTPLIFKLEEYSKDKAQVSGYTTIKRTQFGVGQGKWSKTDLVQDDVQIKFSITAKRK